MIARHALWVSEWGKDGTGPCISKSGRIQVRVQRCCVGECCCPFIGEKGCEMWIGGVYVEGIVLIY